MKIAFDKDSNGVLLAVSKKGLQNFYENREFDYDFPDGILPAINAGIVAALVTETTEEVKGIAMDEAMNEYRNYKLVGEQNLFFEENDELFILDHAEFTQICDWHKGDIDAYSFYNDRISVGDLKPGWTILFTHVKGRSTSATIKVIFQLIPVKVRFPYPEISDVPRF